jgi:hypothetical protein
MEHRTKSAQREKAKRSKVEARKNLKSKTLYLLKNVDADNRQQPHKTSHSKNKVAGN